MEMLLNGKDQFDLDQQIWALRSKVTITKVHPTDTMPLELSPQRFGQKIEAGDRVTVLIEYEEGVGAGPAGVMESPTSGVHGGFDAAAFDTAAFDSVSRDAPPLDFEDIESILRWLDGQPYDVALVFAARAALRAVPMLRPRFKLAPKYESRNRAS